MRKLEALVQMVKGNGTRETGLNENQIEIVHCSENYCRICTMLSQNLHANKETHAPTKNIDGLVSFAQTL